MFNRHFGNVYDFVFQAYQISISNFTHNTLFRQFALQDLADLLRLKLLIFHKLTRHNDDAFEVSVHEPTGHGGDEYIYMLNDEFDIVKYKWLMPTKHKALFNERFLTSSFRVSELACKPRRSKAKNFLKASALYTHHMFVVSWSELYKCFHVPCSSDVNQLMFAFFLKEAPVQTMMHKMDAVSFGDILARNDPAHTVKCFNSLWGKPHFQLNELLSLQRSQSGLQKVRKPQRHSRKSKKSQEPRTTATATATHL